MAPETRALPQSIGSRPATVAPRHDVARHRHRSPVVKDKVQSLVRRFRLRTRLGTRLGTQDVARVRHDPASKLPHRPRTTGHPRVVAVFFLAASVVFTEGREVPRGFLAPYTPGAVHQHVFPVEQRLVALDVLRKLTEPPYGREHRAFKVTHPALVPVADVEDDDVGGRRGRGAVAHGVVEVAGVEVPHRTRHGCRGCRGCRRVRLGPSLVAVVVAADGRVSPSSSLLPRRLGAAGGRLEGHDLRDESHAEIVEEARTTRRALVVQALRRRRETGLTSARRERMDHRVDPDVTPRGGPVDALASDPQLAGHAVRPARRAQLGNQRRRVGDGDVRVEEDDGALRAVALATAASLGDRVARTLGQPSRCAVEARDGRGMLEGGSRHRAGRVGWVKGAEGPARGGRGGGEAEWHVASRTLVSNFFWIQPRRVLRLIRSLAKRRTRPSPMARLRREEVAAARRDVLSVVVRPNPARTPAQNPPEPNVIIIRCRPPERTNETPDATLYPPP